MQRVATGLALCIGLFLCARIHAVEPQPARANSPTGRNPKLVWTPERQAVWNRMRRENHPLWGLVKSAADRTGTGRDVYGDYGQWATLAYQVTGDRDYAARAWRKVEPLVTRDPKSGNDIREYFEQYVLLYDWLYPALTASQRATYQNGIERWARAALGVSKTTRIGGFRIAPIADYDATVGAYFGLAFTDIVMNHSGSGRWLSGKDGSKPPVVLGGLHATAADRSTVRNALRFFVEKECAGGESIESSQYNHNTLKLLLTGVEGVRTATGQDWFPEVRRLIPQAALCQLYQITPDLKDAYQWGDNEHPHDIHFYKRMTLLGILAGLTQQDANAGPYIHELIRECFARYGRNAQPGDVQFYYFFNPYAAHSDWRKKLPGGRYAAGRGLLYFHDGWGIRDSLFGAQITPPSHEDHDIDYLGDFQLYRDGEWVVTHPIVYGDLHGVGGTNTMLIAGFSAAETHREPLAHEFGARGEYAYFVGQTGGPMYRQPYYDPPPAFLHEWTRSLFYLPSPDKRSDTVIVFDRVLADDPRHLPKLDRYRPKDLKTIQKISALKQWVIHTPVAPSVSASGLSWDTPGGQRVRVSTLLPARQTRRTLDEKPLFLASQEFSYLKTEPRFQVRIAPEIEQRWDTFLNVVQASAPALRLENRLIRSTDGGAAGVLVSREGLPDILVVFGARPASRVITAGFKLRWKGKSTQTEVYMADLDPSQSWLVAAGSLPENRFQVSPSGIGHLQIHGPGEHVLSVRTGQ